MRKPVFCIYVIQSADQHATFVLAIILQSHLLPNPEFQAAGHLLLSQPHDFCVGPGQKLYRQAYS